MTQDQEMDPGNDSAEVDSVSQVPLTRVAGAPVPLGGLNQWLKEGRTLKFEVNPIDNSGHIFISDRDQVDNKKLFVEESRLYGFEIPDSISDDSEEYNEYLKSCFKNFEELIKDLSFQEFMTEPDTNDNKIGVIVEKDSYQRFLQNQENQIVLNSTISKLITDLSSLIEIKLSSQDTIEDPDYKLIQLEESINVLSLINALFFSTKDEILILLINWVNRADIEPDLEFTEEMLSVESPYQQTLFWTQFIKKLVTRGLFSQATNAISKSNYQLLEHEENDLFLIIEDLNILLANYDTVEFSIDNKKFVNWKQKCCELRDNFKNVTIEHKENISIKNLIYDILLILTGLQSSIIKSSTSWYECLLTQFLFMLPSDSLINQYLDISLSNFPLDEDNSLTWERSCVNCLNGNYLKVVKDLEILDKPTATYTSVLLEAKGLYNSYDFLLSGTDKDESISKLLLNDHALECLCHQKLIPIGVGILINLDPLIARTIIAQYLPKFNCYTNDDLEWCMSICAKLKLHSTASTILKINGNKLFDRGQLYEGLDLFSKSGDLKILNDKCWLIFENSIVKSDTIADETINSLILSQDIDWEETQISDSMRQCLSPYAVFMLFLQAKEANDLVKLISYILQLLSFKYLPQKYFPLILCQLLPFFQDLTTSSTNINPSNTQIITEDNLISLLELINRFDLTFIQRYRRATKSVKPSKDDQLVINQFEDSQDLYKLAISKEYKDQVQNKEHDWRFQLDLMYNDEFQFQETVEDLLLYIREKISTQIGWCFIDDL